MHRSLSLSKFIVLCVAIIMALPALGFLLYEGSTGVAAQQPNSNRNLPEDQCESKPDGAPCALRGESRPCRAGRCRDNICRNEPAPVGRSCPDLDGNACTIPGCSSAGTCNQNSRVLPDGSELAPISVNDVEVTASTPRVRQATSFNDCCGSCEAQDLEALVPVPQGTPKRLETDGGLPLRRKFCGTVAKYGVNDEKADPRDITINILPAPLSPFRDFLTGFINTPQTQLEGDNLKRFGPSATQFNLQECLNTAKDTSGKVIHAEVTPDEHFYGADGRFLPIESSLTRCGLNPKCLKCIDGWNCESELEPSDRRAGAEVCVYGIYAYDHGNEHRASSHNTLCRVLDTDHDHPEMHPFDAIWWRHPERTGWMFGVFQDDSNRYSFPHCSNDNNGNDWSQAPRDLTFRFPFRFPLRSAPQHACLRHVRSRKLRDNSANTVRPLNVTTGAFVNPDTEALVLNLGGKRVVDVIKESGTGQETHVRVEGQIVGNDIVGQIILRVAIGCDERSGVRCGRFAKPSDTFDALKIGNQLVTYDKGDPGAGYFYAELTFECNCSSR